MASSSSPAEPKFEQRQDMNDIYASFIHNTSLAMLFLAPVLIALPPRKLDLYTFTLVGAFAASANQLTRERNAVGLLGFLPGRDIMTRKAQDVQERFRGDKEKKRLLEEPQASSPRFVEAAQTRQQSKLGEKAKDIWMGGETEGWKEKRLREEQEKISQGEGYGSMIMDQIWDVWNWGEKKGEELEEKDREVIEQKEKEKRNGQRTA